mmetsp:Transcript_517/g.1820  ORF Transcript_517/g.1820 Transcript_517/m.1820 type:complete len:474 (+) Transcript_517:207-1628(+)
MTDALHYAPSPQQPVCPAGDAYSNPLVFAPDLLCGPGGLPAHAALLLPKPVFGATAIVLAVGTMAARLLPRLWASKGRKGKALEDFTVLASPIALDDLLEERPSARGARERPEGSSRSAGKPLTSGAGGCTRGDAQGQVGLEDHVTADQPFPVQEDHVADLFARLSLDPDHEHSEWEPFSSKRSKTLSQKVWKKRRSAHLELRCLTVYEGLSVEEVTGFYLDREHQIAQYGDSSSLEVLEEHASGEYYRCHCSYPWPLASREYVYGRRAFLNMGIDGSQAVFISKGCEHPQMQMGKKASKKGVVLVSEYESSMVVSSFNSGRGQATVVESIYMEGGPHPRSGPIAAAFNVATRKVVWHMAETTERSVRLFQKRRMLAEARGEDGTDSASDEFSEPDTPSSPLGDLGPFGAAKRSPFTAKGRLLNLVPKRVRAMIRRNVWRRKERIGTAMRMLMIVSLMTRGKAAPIGQPSSVF